LIVGFWDTVARALGDRIEREASQELLRRKIPATKGLAAETVGDRRLRLDPETNTWVEVDDAGEDS